MTGSPHKIIENIKSIGLLACIVILFISIKSCKDNALNYEGSKNYLASLNDSITFLKAGVARKGAVLVSEDFFKSIVKENNGLKKALKDAETKAKNVRTVTTVVTNTKIDTITIRLTDTLPGNFKPVPFVADNQFYNIAGIVSKTSISFNKISFPDSLYVITANKKHFFKKNEFLVSIGHSNKYVKTIGLTNLTISENKKWYNSSWLKFGVGFVAGGYVTYRLKK